MDDALTEPDSDLVDLPEGFEEPFDRSFARNSSPTREHTSSHHGEMELPHHGSSGLSPDSALMVAVTRL